jgi:hypothetical protein
MMMSGCRSSDDDDDDDDGGDHQVMIDSEWHLIHLIIPSGAVCNAKAFRECTASLEA